jgi:excisionase family DNA binding protein
VRRRVDDIKPFGCMVPREAAAKLGVSRQRLHCWIMDGRVDVIRVGRTNWIRDTDVEALGRARKGIT